MQLIIFDCDGTLVDSLHTIFGRMTAAFKGLGGPKELWLFPHSGHGNAHNYPAKEPAWLEQLIAKSELEVRP